jgi:nucleotide-binding universal stress UspA family protein
MAAMRPMLEREDTVRDPRGAFNVSSQIEQDQLSAAAMHGPLIVVGYDGSDESREALPIAGQRAGPQRTVVAVHVTESAPDWHGAPYYGRAIAQAHRAAERLLDEIAEGDVGPATIERDVAEGQPADALLLVAQSRNAQEIVVGSRGLGRMRAVLGGVSHRLLERSGRPVVIVPPRDRRS